MPATLQCPECRAKLTVPDKHSDRGIVCPLCAARLRVEGGGRGTYRLLPELPPPLAVPVAPLPAPHAPVQVIVQNVYHAKEEKSWLAEHVREVVGGVVVAALAALATAVLAYLGLSEKKKTEDKAPAVAKAKQPVTRPASRPVTQPAPVAQVNPADPRVRWLNASYHSTIAHAGGKDWVETDDQTGQVKWKMTERARTPEYIELHNASRNQVVRLYARRMDSQQGGRWEWLSNGSWASQ